jgi:hypothetical protein
MTRAVASPTATTFRELTLERDAGSLNASAQSSATRSTLARVWQLNEDDQGYYDAAKGGRATRTKLAPGSVLESGLCRAVRVT